MRTTVLFFQALFGLVTYDLVPRQSKFKIVRRFVAGWKVNRRTARPELAAQIARAINLACICYPKQVLCLQRSSVTTCLMRSHGIAAKMVLGAQKTPFQAHAWVEVDGHAVNERTVLQAQYQVWERF